MQLPLPSPPRGPTPFLALLAGICIALLPLTSVSASEPLDLWDGLLATYRTDDGGFRYQALLENAEDLGKLRALVDWVGTHEPPQDSRSETLAFRINAYNILTVRAVLTSWPMEGVMTVPGFFDAVTHRVSGSEMTLNTLENEHIRAAFGEPRIHFVVNCASTGCPPLAGVALRAANLEEVMERQTRAFVEANTHMVAIEQRVELSQIFEWFAADFTASEGVRRFVARYLTDDRKSWILEETTSLSYRPYDWSLNSR